EQVAPELQEKAKGSLVLDLLGPFGCNDAISSIALLWGRKLNLLQDFWIWEVVQGFIGKLACLSKFSKARRDCAAKSVLLRTFIRGEPIYPQASSVWMWRRNGNWLRVVVTENAIF